MIGYRYYKDTFGGRYGEEIVPWLRRSFMLIDSQTIAADEEDIADAVCVQAEAMIGDGVTQLSLGDYSEKRRAEGPICSEAMALLQAAGLCYRGVPIGGVV